jgi:hypothetical protein
MQVIVGHIIIGNEDKFNGKSFAIHKELAGCFSMKIKQIGLDSIEI